MGPMRGATLAAVGLFLVPRVVEAQEIYIPEPEPDTSGTPDAEAKEKAKEEGLDLECIKHATTRKQLFSCIIKPDQVEVRAKPPPRSASDWEVDEEFIRAAPRQSGADVLESVPGLFVTDRGVPGRAPHLSLRGFDGTSGQNAEIFVSNIPLNQT